MPPKKDQKKKKKKPVLIGNEPVDIVCSFFTFLTTIFFICFPKLNTKTFQALTKMLKTYKRKCDASNSLPSPEIVNILNSAIEDERIPVKVGIESFDYSCDK